MKVVGGRLRLRRPAPAPSAAPPALTPAQLEIRGRAAERIAARIQKSITNPHRKRRKEYHNFLESLETQFEIPKVGPF